MNMPKGPAVIFTSLLLPPSETFVQSLADAETGYASFFAACRRVPGIFISPEHSFTVSDGSVVGKIQEIWFKLTGRAAKLERNLRKLSPALIHAQFGTGGVLCLQLAERLDLPLIVRFLGADATQNPQSSQWQSLTHWLYARHRHSLYQRASLILAVSDFIRGKLIADGAPSEKIVVFHTGIDTEKFQPDPAADRKNILFVGRLAATKGCDDAIHAMQEVQKRFPETILLIVGDGPLRPKLESLAAELGIRCQFLGLRKHDDVIKLMQQSMLLLAPSVTCPNGESEGLPTVILEAAGCGLPVVSTYHAGIPEAVEHGVTGLLSQEHDVRMIASHCLRLLADPAMRASFGLAARERVCRQFSLSGQSQFLGKIYDEVVHKFHARHGGESRH